MLGFDIFLCHRRTDAQPLALASREFLRRNGMSVFMDISEREPGEFGARLRKSVKNSKYVVALKTHDMFPEQISQLDTSRDWVAVELDTAHRAGVPIITIEHDSKSGFPEYIHPSCVIPYKDGELDDVLQELKQRIRRTPYSHLRGIMLRYIWYAVYMFCLLAACIVLTETHSVLRSTAPAARAKNQAIQQQIDKAEEKIKELEWEEGHTLLLIDTTGTMRSKFPRIVTHAEQLVKRYPAREVVVILFSDEGEEYVVKEWNRGNDVPAVIRSILNVPATAGGDQPEGSDKAMMFARKLFSKEGVTTGHVVLFTDAPANNRDDFIYEVRRLSTSGVAVTLVACDVSHKQLGWIEMEGVSIAPLIRGK